MDITDLSDHIAAVEYNVEERAVIPVNQQAASIIDAIDRSLCSHRRSLKVIHIQ